MNGNYDHARDLLEVADLRQLGFDTPPPEAEVLARAQVYALLALTDAVTALARPLTRDPS